MSTPMRHGLSQQGRTPSHMPGAAPTPSVSTPFSNSQTQAAFSPPPGSRTSPQQFKKSPATSATLKQMPDQHLGAVNFDSPSATAALNSLGIHGNLDLNLSMGSLGLGTRVDEDDRKKRMDALTHLLKAGGKGKVSNEGLERLARSIGLECIWEDNAARGPQSKVLVIAGHGLALDIVITNHVVENVTLTLPESTPIVQENVGKAADILLRDLKLEPNQSPLTKTLEKFQPNLERLAALDRLSSLPLLNCYDAVAGIYESLLKLHNWDVQKLREDPMMHGKSAEFLKVTALCTRHGCPLMHVRDRIGLSLDFWKERRKQPSTMVEREDINTWSFLVECAPKDETMLFPVRVSNNWISDDIEKTGNMADDGMLATFGSSLDWQEPNNTFLASTEDSKDAPVTLPEVIFMATLDPPVIVSAAVAAHIYTACALQPPESSATFDALVFPIVGSNYDPSEPRTVERVQMVSNFVGYRPGDDKSKYLKPHKNTLFIYKPVYGQVLSKLPIQHPRQLMQMLPVLRQYAFLSTLLAKSFKPKPGFPEYSAETPQSKSTSRTTTTTTARDDFASFMFQAPKDAAAAPPPLAVDITLTPHPVPRLQIVFPFKEQTANITLEIQEGGKVHVVSDNVFEPDEEPSAAGGPSSSAGAKTGRYTRSQFAGLLETAEDIGIWVEYIKHKLE